VEPNGGGRFILFIRCNTCDVTHTQRAEREREREQQQRERENDSDSGSDELQYDIFDSYWYRGT
jgi:hypothetical protein